MAVVLARLARAGALGALVFHPSHFAHFCCRGATDVAFFSAGYSARPSPAPEPTYLVIVTSPPPPPMRMSGPNYSFLLPGGWWQDDSATGYVYRDTKRRHAVRILLEGSDESPDDWITRRFPGAEATWARTLGRSSASFVTKAGSKLRVTAAVIADARVVYELACTSDAPSSESDATCESVLATFRVGE